MGARTNEDGQIGRGIVVAEASLMSQVERVPENDPTASDSGGQQLNARATRRLVPFRLEVVTEEDEEEDTLVVRTKDQRRIVASAFADLELDEQSAVPSERGAYARNDGEGSASEGVWPLQSGTRLIAAGPASELPRTDPSPIGSQGSPTVPAFDDAFVTACMGRIRDDGVRPPGEAFRGSLPSIPVDFESTLPVSSQCSPGVQRGSSAGLLSSSLSAEGRRALRASTEETARRAQVATTWMRMVVVGIWGTAFVLAVLLALFARIGS